MRRIDTPTAAQDLFGPGKHGFRDGDPLIAVLATRLNAAFFNSVQEELARLVEGAGVVLDSNDNGQLIRALRGGDATLNASTALTAAHAGVLHLDAAGGARTFTLPPAASAKTPHDFILRRVDNSGNRLVVQASGAEKIQFHTHLNAAGYSFFVLMGAGDWWRLRSDGTTWQQVTATVIDASNDQPKPLTPGAPGAPGVAGVAGQASRADHSHAMDVHDIAAHASIPLSAYAPATAAIDMGGHPMTGLATPEDSTDAATRDYADRMLG